MLERRLQTAVGQILTWHFSLHSKNGNKAHGAFCVSLLLLYELQTPTVITSLTNLCTIRIVCRALLVPSRLPYLGMRSSVYPLRRIEQQLTTPVQRVRPESRSPLSFPLPAHNTACREGANHLLCVSAHGLRLQTPYRGSQTLCRHLAREVPLVSQKRGVEDLHSGHVFGQGACDKLEQEAQAAEDSAADLGSDIR